MCLPFSRINISSNTSPPRKLGSSNKALYDRILEQTHHRCGTSTEETLANLVLEFGVVHDTARHIYGDDPGEWIHWLEERVIIYKTYEQIHQAYINAVRGNRYTLYHFHGKRLGAEAELFELLEAQSKKP